MAKRLGDPEVDAYLREWFDKTSLPVFTTIICYPSLLIRRKRLQEFFCSSAHMWLPAQNLVGLEKNQTCWSKRWENLCQDHRLKRRCGAIFFTGTIE
jgi:hypothetical protein